MDINLERYWDSCQISKGSSALMKTYKRLWAWFYNKHKSEFKNYNTYWLDSYDSCKDYAEWKSMKPDVEKHNPTNVHKIEYLFVKIPNDIHHWLCCGSVQKDPVTGQESLNDAYHMGTKLCRYKTWPDVKITWWDRIRFWLITGYRFEDERGV